MWLLSSCSFHLIKLETHFSSLCDKRATQIQSRCLRHLFSVKWNTLLMWLWDSWTSYTIIIKCSGNSFCKESQACVIAAEILNGKTCCFLLMTTRNEKCVVFNVSKLCCRSLQLTDICPWPLSGSSKSLATQHIEQQFFYYFAFQ